MSVFADTNLLVYVFDHGSPAKREIARHLLAERAGDLVLSAQVLSEFYWVVTRKLRPPLPAGMAREAVEHLATFPVVAIDRRLVTKATETAHREQLSLWDAQIVEAAAVAGCDTLLTEDLEDGRVIRGVEVVNPFASVP